MYNCVRVWKYGSDEHLWCGCEKEHTADCIVRVNVQSVVWETHEERAVLTITRTVVCVQNIEVKNGLIAGEEKRVYYPCRRV